MRRLFWVAVGVAGAAVTLREARDAADRHLPGAARSAVGSVGGLLGFAHRVAAEFRAGTAQREAQLRADLLAGADLAGSRRRLGAWRAERAAARTANTGPDAADDAAAPATAAPGPAGRRTGGHRAEDPDDGPAGYSFF